MKGVIHALLLGCLIPVLGYNYLAGNKLNTRIYMGWAALETWQIYQHIRSTEKASHQSSSSTAS